MARSYLPQALAVLLEWSGNFAGLIDADPPRYGLTAGDATTIQGAQNTYADAYSASNTPSTRTPVTVQATIDARNAMVAIIRNYARLILANSGVADADKTALGLIIRDPTPTPVPTPLTNPIMSLVGVTPGQITLSYKDSTAGGHVKAKPFGAIQAQIFVKIGSTPPASPADTPFQKSVTKSPFFVDTTGADAGDPVYIYARWITQRGLVGPWSPLVTAHALAP